MLVLVLGEPSFPRELLPGRDQFEDHRGCDEGFEAFPGPALVVLCEFMEM